MSSYYNVSGNNIIRSDGTKRIENKVDNCIETMTIFPLEGYNGVIG
jgi:hypothetical protein